MKFTIGSDPEVFVKDIKTGKIASIIGKLGGTKQEPLSIENNCSVQEDNILAEFNIPPVDNEKDFIAHINHSKDYISTIAASHGLELHYSSSELVNKDILEGADEFGCAPSINVLTEEIVQVKLEDIPEEMHNLRTSGFHIHFGNEQMTDEQKIRMVFCFEVACSIPMAVYDYDPHNRRQFYGLFGDCRFKDYGVECRSLGGYFLKDDETLSIIWKGIERTIELFNTESVTTDEIKNMVDYCLGDNNELIKENIKEVTNDLKNIKVKQ